MYVTVMHNSKCNRFNKSVCFNIEFDIMSGSELQRKQNPRERN